LRGLKRLAFFKVYEYENDKNMKVLKEVTNFPHMYRRNTKKWVKNIEGYYKNFLVNEESAKIEVQKELEKMRSKEA
jgi:hypothetical protein